MPNPSRTGAGSDFLRTGSAPVDVFTPEDFSEEQRMIRDLAQRFVEDEILPAQPQIEQQDWPVTVALLKKSAALGLIAIEVPECYGGSELDRVSAMIVAEAMGRVSSFSVSCGGQSGIGLLPILYFGSETLRKAYLPLLCSSEMLAAYALSEASSGSDALAAKTTAVRSPDGGHWILNGEKMWVTNAAFADVFITFAKVDGKHLSCFLVEKSFPGVSTGAEEHKMGLKGSSTRPVALVEVPVPIGNLIGEIGKGHHVALNILNIGRARLGASAVGASKTALQAAIRYAKQRTAFGQSISTFGAIQHKLAEMAIRIWVAEGITYRTGDLMDQAIQGVDIDDRAEVLRALKEYAVECSIVKVFGSETLDYVVDEAVQIFGGYGISAEYPVERYYRDARVNRIFEGTNEINRLTIAEMLLKSRPETSDLTETSGPLGVEAAVLGKLKKVFALVMASVGKGYSDTQEILLLLADIAIGIYAIDTAFHRTRKMINAGSTAEVEVAMFRTFLNDEVSRIAFSARQIVAATKMGASIDPLLQWTPIDTIATRRLISKHMLE